MKYKLFLLLASVMFFYSSCDDNEDSYLDIAERSIVFDYFSDSREVTVKSGSDLVCGVPNGISWCEPTYENGVIKIDVKTNPNTASRSTIVFIVQGDARGQIKVEQKGREVLDAESTGETKIIPVAATASAQQSDAESIQKTYDGDYNTMYHSPYGTTTFPVTLTYEFKDADIIEKFTYHPRLTGVNGNFKEFELWVATEDSPDLKKYGNYNFQGSGEPSTVVLDTPILNATTIQFMVKSGEGNFVSCAEMEFAKSNDDIAQFMELFTDETCSELKSTITEEDINKIEVKFYRDMALEILRGDYDKEYRVRDYEPYQDPSVLATANKTSTYSLRDNVTGVYVKEGEPLLVFVGEMHNQKVSVFVQHSEPKFSGDTFKLVKGFNQFVPTKDGLVYILYHTEDMTEPAVRINIASGNINGYFDSQKHSSTDWKRLISEASHKTFDVVGKYAHLTFDTEGLRTYTPDAKALIDVYDELVYMEWEFMGLVKYNKTPKKNRMYFLVDYGDTYMYATSYYTGYTVNTMNTVCDAKRLKTTDYWGPAHEVGHSNQTRPGIRWFGLGEVTNNIMSLHVGTSWGNQSRPSEYGDYAYTLKNYVNKNIPHHLMTDSDKSGIYNGVFYKLVPFWQLKLYLMDALGKEDFYKDLYELYRNTDYTPSGGSTSDGFYQLKFVENVCQVANLDLTAFFESWGFLTPVDTKGIMDATTRFAVTQADIDATKARIAAKGYPKPAHDNIYTITDDNVASFK